MNNNLKKNEVIKYKYQAKYMERHITLCVTLDKKDDKDIIDWLGKQQNRSRKVRAVLRDVARKEAK